MPAWRHFFSQLLWLTLGGALGYWLSCVMADWLAVQLKPMLGVVNALLWTQLMQLCLLLGVAVALLQLAQRQVSLHRLAGALLLPLAVLVSASGTLSLYRAELDLALTPALAPVQHSEVTVPAAQQLQLAMSYQQQHFPAATQLYVELAGARKPYVTLHLQHAGSWLLTRQWLQITPAQSAEPAPDDLPSDLPSVSSREQSQVLPLGPAVELTPGNSRHTVGELFFSMHYQLVGLIKRAAQPLLIGLSIAIIAMACAGLMLMLRRWRQMSSAVARPELWGRGPLRWHLLAGVLTVPWLCWFFGSALLTQYGNWYPALLSDSDRQQYYQQLFPSTSAAPSTAASAVPSHAASASVNLSQLLQASGWPVAKIQLDLTNGRWLLTEQAAWPQTAPYQLRQQTFDGALQPLASTSAVSSILSSTSSGAPWQLRNLGYAAHQSLYAGPLLRALLAFGGVLTVFMLCVAAESYGRKQHWLALSLWRSLSFGMVGATLVFCAVLALSDWQRVQADFTTSFGYCWLLVAAACFFLTGWQYRRRA